MQTRMQAYKKLGLIGNSANALPVRKDVDYPTDQINIARLLDGHQDCFVQVVPVNIEADQKKKVIITDWSYRHGMATDKPEIGEYVKDLIRDGFDVYVWTGQLTRINCVDSVDICMSQIEPIHRQSLKQKLPACHLAADECYIIDVKRMDDDFNFINNLSSRNIPLTLSINRKIPAKLLEQLLNTISDEDSVTLVMNENLSNKQLDVINHFLETHHALEIKYSAMLQRCSDTIRFDNVNRLKLASISTLQELSNTLKLMPSLESLEIESSSSRLRTNDLPPLYKLKTFISDISELKGDTLDAFLEAAPNLENLTVVLSDRVAPVLQNTGSLAKLKELRFSSNTVYSVDSKPCLIKLLSRAPHLKILDICKHTFMDVTSADDVSLNDLEVLKFTESKFNDIAFKKMVASSASLKELTFRSCNLPSDWTLPASLSQLESLDLTDTWITKNTFEHLPLSLPKLKTLKISKLKASTVLLVQNQFAFPELEHLEINFDQPITEPQLAYLLQSMPKLKKLIITYPYGRQLTITNPHTDREVSILDSGKHTSPLNIEWIFTEEKNVKSLQLSSFECFDEFSSNAISPTLETLVMKEANIGFKTYVSLLNNLPKLTELDLTNSKIKESLYPSLNNCVNTSLVNTSLKYLCLRNATLEGYLNKFLAYTPNLKTLDLSDCTFNYFYDSSIPLKELESLSLNSTRINLRTLFHMLQQTPKLKSLNLRGCSRLDDVMKDFETGSLSELETLDLTDASISIFALNELLKRCPKLKSLNLSNAHISHHGAVIEKVNLPALEILDISNTELSSDNVSNMLSTSSKLKRLIAEGNSCIKDSPIFPVKMPDLYDVNIACTGILFNAFEDLLLKAPHLHHLQMMRCPNLGTNKDLSSAISLPDLEILDASYSNITFTNLGKMIKDSKELNTLDISQSHCLADGKSNVTPFTLPRLTTINAEQSDINNRQFAALIKHSKMLDTIRLRNCRNLTGDFDDDLYCPNLQMLDFYNSEVSSDLFSALTAGANALVQLNLESTTLRPSTKPIEPTSLPYLKSLSANDSKMEAEQLAALIHDADNMTTLGLNRCIINGDFTHTISCRKLDAINLDGATISSELLGAILEQTPELTNLDMDNITIKPDGFLLPVSLPKLEVIRTKSNTITGDHIAAILSDAAALKRLYLSKSKKLSEYSGVPIACPELCQLYLDDVEMNSQLLGAILSQGQKLTELKILESKLTDDNIESLNLSSLENLVIRNSKIRAQQISAILANASALTQLHVVEQNANQVIDMTDESQLASCPKLATLEMARVNFRSKLLNQLLQSTELTTIKLDKCNVISDHAITPVILNKLETVDINDSNMCYTDIAAILNAAPNVSNLTLDRCSQLVSNSTSSQLLKITLNKLTSLCMSHSMFDPEVLSDILNHSPALEELRFDSARISPGNFNLTTPLPKLEKMWAHGSNIDNDQVISILNQASALEDMSLSGCYSINYSSLAANMPIMPKLKYFTLYNNRTSIDDIYALVAKMPNLVGITLERSQITDDQRHALEKKFPNLSIQVESNQSIKASNSASPAMTRFSSAPMSQMMSQMMQQSSAPPPQRSNVSSFGSANSTMRAPASSSRLGSDIYYEKDKGPTHQVNQVFRYKSFSNPHMRDYRMSGFTDIEIGNNISLVMPDKHNLSAVSVNTTVRNLARIYEEKYVNTDNMYLGEIDINAYGWTPLPSLGSRDVIANLESDPNNPVEIRYCQETALYYVKPVQQRSTHVSYLLKHDPNLTDFPVQDEDVSGITLAINQDGSLKCDEKTKARILAMNNDEKINFLASYLRLCRSNLNIDKKNRKTSFKNDIEVMNEILATHTGSCAHTATTFAVLAKAVGIKARVIENDCHQFVEVMHDHRMCRVELGGWPGNININELKNPGIKSYTQVADNQTQEYLRSKIAIAKRRAVAAKQTQAAKAFNTSVVVNQTAPAVMNTVLPQIAISQKPRVKTIDENRFAIWNKQISQAKNAAEYISELLNIAAQMTPGSKNILSMISPDKFETLHKAMIEQTRLAGKKCFYVHHLDDIRTSCYAIDNATGTYSAEDSELIRFIKNAKPGDVLMVNWSDYEAKHVGHNTMLDPVRTIQGIAIPEGVTIIGVLDKSISLGEDFYSRNRFKSTAPDTIAAGNVISPAKSPEQSKLQEIVFYDDQWKREILGEYKIGEQGFQFASSMLLDAISSKKAGVVLRNAPWHLQEFRLAITSLMQQRHIFVNGKIFNVPDNFEITFDDKPLPLNVGKYQISRANAVPDSATLLNQTTLQHFFGSYQCLPNHALSAVPGIISTHSGETLSIYVSAPLTHAAWARLLNEANQYQVQLSISTAQGIDLPAALLAHSVTLPAIKPAPVTSTFKTNVIGTNDITLALSQTDQRDALVIPVNNLTNFADLVERIRFEDHDGKKLFTHSTSILADSLRSGKKIILTGTLSPLLASQLSTLFMPTPYITINGKREDIKNGQLTLITDNNPVPFVKPVLKHYTDNDCYASLKGNATLSTLLKETCEAFYRAAPSFKHFDFNQLSIMLARLESLPTNNPLTPFIRLNAQFDELKPLAQKIWRERKHAAKPAHNEDPISKRLRKVEAELAVSPFVFIAGSSGIGKSRFMQHDFKTLHGKPVKIYESMEKIHEWLADKDENSQHVLFLDEANLQAPGTFDLFAGLMRKPPVINIDGKLLPVPKNKKIVFAGNFRGYKNRLDHAFFHEFGHVITFKEFPDVYLRQHVIDPVLKSCLPNISSATMDAYAKIYLQTYHHLNQLFPDTHPVTARNLQMMAMRTAYLANNPGALPLAIYDEVCGMLNQKQRREIRSWLQEQTGQNIDLKKIKHELKQNVALHSRQFHLTKMRYNAIRQLDCLFALREKKRTTKGLETAGTCGILFEGESGIGKSLMAMEYLNEHGFTLAANEDPTPHDHRHYYHLTPTDPIKMQQTLLKAFHEGAPVIIDELNSLPLEHILNPLLSGVDLDGHPAKNPGFFIIGTQNPSSFVKRQVLSAALLNRLQFVDLKEYGFDDLLEITGTINYSHEISAELTADYKSAKLFARQHHKSPEPTPRDLFSAAKAESRDSSPLSSSAESSPEASPTVKPLH